MKEQIDMSIAPRRLLQVCRAATLSCLTASEPAVDPISFAVPEIPAVESLNIDLMFPGP